VLEALRKKLLHPPSFWVLNFFAWCGFGVIALLVRYVMHDDFGRAVGLTIVAESVGFLCSGLLRQCYLWIGRGRFLRTPMFAVTLVLTLAMACAQSLIVQLLVEMTGWRFLPWSTAERWVLLALLMWIVYMAWSLGYFWVKAELAAHREALDATKARGEAQRIELQLLRAQLDPHFLFNSLNGIASEIQPHPKVATGMVRELADLLDPGDTIIDGGNSYFKDDVRRAGELAPRGVHYVDVGTSGGVWGLERGYCLMIGGPGEPVERLDPIFRTLAPGRGTIPGSPGRQGGTAEEGYLHCGPVGAGHFVKMIHNGIEYGLMQAYAEGFDILRCARNPELPEAQRFDLNLADIAELWRRGSVVSSWLLDLSAAALAKDPGLEGFTGVVQDSGEGRWTIQTAIEEAVPADVLSAALYTRFRSRQEHTFAEKTLSAMRAGFGGHQEPKA